MSASNKNTYIDSSDMETGVMCDVIVDKYIALSSDVSINIESNKSFNSNSDITNMFTDEIIPQSEEFENLFSSSKFPNIAITDKTDNEIIDENKFYLQKSDVV